MDEIFGQKAYRMQMKPINFECPPPAKRKL